MKLKLLRIVVCCGIFLLVGCGKGKKGAEVLIREFMSASVTEEELLTPGSELANAILYATEIEVIDESKNDCRIKITYPNVKPMLEEALAERSGELDAEEVEEILDGITQKIESQDVLMAEEMFELSIVTDEEGMPQIEWTKEAARAMSGGLYGAE